MAVTSVRIAVAGDRNSHEAEYSISVSASKEEVSGYRYEEEKKPIDTEKQNKLVTGGIECKVGWAKLLMK